MFRWKTLLLIALSFVCAAIQSPAQDMGPRAPALGVKDESGFFSKDSGAQARITQQIRQLDQKRGYKIYLVVERVLLSGTPSDYASELRRTWLPDGEGLVLVYEADSGQLGVGREILVTPDQKPDPRRIPVNELDSILSSVLLPTIGSTNARVAPEANLEAIITGLTASVEAYYKRLETPTPEGRGLKIGALILGIVSVFGLIAIGVGSLMRFYGASNAKRFQFPPVNLPERLGAPCGASVIASRFRPTSTGQQ